MVSNQGRVMIARVRYIEKPSFCDFPRKQSLNKLEFEKGAAQEMIFDISMFSQNLSRRKNIEDICHFYYITENISHMAF